MRSARLVAVGEVYCADGDYECLARELRHVVDPTWQHDLDFRSVSAR